MLPTAASVGYHIDYMNPMGASITTIFIGATYTVIEVTVAATVLTGHILT